MPDDWRFKRVGFTTFFFFDIYMHIILIVFVKFYSLSLFFISSSTDTSASLFDHDDTRTVVSGYVASTRGCGAVFL